MRKLSLLLAVVMLFSLGSISSLAEETATQVEIKATSKPIIEVDGLQFKDLNNNGTLDVYEDWRADIEERITDLYSQMTIEEKTALFYHICTCGDSSGVDFSDSRYLYEENCPFDVPAAGAEVSGPMTSGSYSMYYFINELDITHFLDNSNGTPVEQISYHNAIQEMGEATRLGIPITLSSDRQYNGWGGMVDTAHDALGTANDVELAEKLWTIYSVETRNVGYHILLHPYGMELGSWNGEDPAYAGEMSKAEINAIQVQGGAYACAKHFIARGGDSSFSNARSDAQTVDNWMTAWKKALEANPKWLMTNGYSTGLSNTVHVDYDAETMNYLRDTLGYEGVILSDWGAQGADNSSGTTADGIVLDELTIPERYAFAINLGLDQIGSPSTAYNEANPGYTSDRGAVQAAYEQGLITEERMEETCRRVLRTKFELGLFENPYNDVDTALAYAASDEYIAQAWDITDLTTLTAARNPETVELERQLQAESAVLVKNDGDLLPLSKDAKIYFDSTAAAETKSAILAALGEYATIADNMADADVVIADCTSFNDAAELVVEDAKGVGKKLVIVSNCVDPTTWAMENGDAVLFMNFSRPADHGTGAGGFITTTEPIVYAELLYGVREPSGMIVKEIARDSVSDDAQWKDLAGDQGADPYVRMMLLATMKTSENNETPRNWGDPLLCYQYGMRYGQSADIVYDTLVLPRVTKEIVSESNGSTTTSYKSVIETKAGEPFTLYMLVWNNGADGVTTVQAKDGDEVIAEKIMAVNSGDWRVVEMELTIDTAGEHVITVGNLSKIIDITE